MRVGILNLLKLIRVYQWPKNVFVFLPLFFSGHIFQVEKLLSAFIIFFVFCIVSSCVYIINDIADVKSDRMHPEKKNRPIASGAIKINVAVFLFILLLLSSFGTAFVFFTKAVALFLLAYLLVNLLYSFRLKHMAIIDITIIAVGFIIRIMVGGRVTDVILSKWIVLMTFLLSVFLALAKRRDDLLLFETSGKSMRKSLDGYNMQFVNYSMVFASSIIVVCYIMYTISEDVVKRIEGEYFYITSFFVVLGVLRYMQITFVEGNSGSPSKILLKDAFTIVNLLLWCLTVAYFIYV